MMNIIDENYYIYICRQTKIKKEIINIYESVTIIYGMQYTTQKLKK